MAELSNVYFFNFKLGDKVKFKINGYDEEGIIVALIYSKKRSLEMKYDEPKHLYAIEVINSDVQAILHIEESELSYATAS